MSAPSLFKIKYKGADGKPLTSKNYYFYFGRKKINTGIAEKKSATAFAEKYIAEHEEEKETQHRQSMKKSGISTTPSLLEKLRKEGWISFNENNECQYWNNPKYKKAQSTQGMTYGVTQAKQVARVLYRVFETYGDSLGNAPYNQISKSDAVAFRGRLATYDMPNSMKNETMKAIRAIYTFWDYDETIIYNPFKKSSTLQDFPTQTKDERDIFSETELKTIFSKKIMKMLYPEDKQWLDFLESDYFNSFKFCALTGMRSSEARALIPSQIENDRILTINRAFKEKNVKASSIGLPKCEKTRVIVLCDSAYKIIRDKLTSIEEDDYIFKNDTGNNALEISKWNKKWVYFMGKVQEKLQPVFGGRYFTPHCLRKTLNTILVNKYHCNNELVIDYLGWGENGTKSSLSKVQKEHYTRTKAEDLLVVAQVIEKMYSGKEMLWTLSNKNEKTKSDAELNKMITFLVSGLPYEG